MLLYLSLHEFIFTHYPSNFDCRMIDSLTHNSEETGWKERKTTLGTIDKAQSQKSAANEQWAPHTTNNFNFWSINLFANYVCVAYSVRECSFRMREHSKAWFCGNKKFPTGPLSIHPFSSRSQSPLKKPVIGSRWYCTVSLWVFLNTVHCTHIETMYLKLFMPYICWNINIHSIKNREQKAELYSRYEIRAVWEASQSGVLCSNYEILNRFEMKHIYSESLSCTKFQVV